MTYHLCFSVGKTEGAECTSCWTPVVGAHAKMIYQMQVCRQHCVTIKKAGYEKKADTRILKKISSRNQRDVGMGG